MILEGSSRTTQENAQRSLDIWKENRIRSGLLVTSALHMPRALALFRHAGFDVTPATTDVTVTWPLYETPLDLIPSAAALSLSSDALREWLGIIVGKLRGTL